MPCPLKLSNCSNQEDISSCTGPDIERYWHQNCCVLNKVYVLVVIRHVTGPMAMNIDIILPAIYTSKRPGSNLCIFGSNL